MTQFIKSYIIFVILSLSWVWGQCDEGYTAIDGGCYYQSDLDVLQIFIDNSQGGENPPPSDLLPIEVGEQVWENGRLVELCSSNSSYTDPQCYKDYELSGQILQEIGNLTNLTYLNLGYNELTGSIPPEIGNLTNLEILWLYSNQLTGSIPPEIGNLTNLTYLSLGSNELTGLIPESICDLNMNWSNPNYFNISNNQLCPPYPSCIEDYVGNQDTSDCD